LEISILDWLNSHHIPGSVVVLQTISAYTTWINIAAILAVLLLAWRNHSKPLLQRFLILALVMVVSALCVYLLKEIIDRERPFYDLPFIEKLSTGGGSSFPSGHTTESFGLAMAFTFIFRIRRLSLLFFCWAGLVAYTRLALGVHYPTDILAGAALGIFTGWIIPAVLSSKTEAYHSGGRPN
jgi:undecaprenyl-diphosphatase